MEKTLEKSNNGVSNTTGKKQWVTPEVDIISKNKIQTATTAPGAENASHYVS